MTAFTLVKPIANPFGHLLVKDGKEVKGKKREKETLTQVFSCEFYEISKNPLI